MRRSVTHGDLRSPQRTAVERIAILLNLVEPDVARATRRSSAAGHWLSAFVFLYLPSDAEHHVLVLQGPYVQHGQTAI